MQNCAKIISERKMKMILNKNHLKKYFRNGWILSRVKKIIIDFY